ncbi:nitric oxide dioxygenase [Angomonas deanei]|nr:nitric oxide dioxygenase [Angomonas deanei]|eukprot:EPY14997.1 nitric oxide dioxygenase [Angomonas deanei]
MLTGNPELKDVFNLAHQHNMRQPKALFDSVVGYATHLRDLQALGPVVERIAQKHASFQITDDQYQIVGHHLLKTIEEKLNPGADVIAEWGKAYEELANILIQREKAIYDTTAEAEGGWRGLRPFKVAEKKKQSDIMTSFKLVPQDGKAVHPQLPGQYLGLFVRHPSMPYQEIRQYSLINVPNKEHYEICVRRHDKGQVSPYLHDTIQEGDELKVVPPFGDFYYQEPSSKDSALVFIAGEDGLTPLLSMIRTLAKEGCTRPVYWLQYAKKAGDLTYAKEVAALPLKNLKTHTWIGEKDGAVDCLAAVPKEVMTNPGTQVYYMGPSAFLDATDKHLRAIGLPGEQSLECFGPFRAPGTA